MAVERYKVGRASYNWRERVAVGMGAEDAQALCDALSVPVAIAEDRLEPAIKWATATLEQKNMPLDPNAWCYSDKDWRRKNERRSAEWYAIEILHNAAWLRRMIQQGNARMADFALDLGQLITEGHFIFNVFVRQGKDGAAQAAEAKRSAPEQVKREARNQGWCKRAAEEWKIHPNYGGEAIAVRIEPDPRKRRNCRRMIAHLNPRKQK